VSPASETQASTSEDVAELARGFSLYDERDMQDPHRIWDAMRERCPVAHSEQLDGFWMLTRYEDVRAALLNHRVFSNKEVMVPRNRMGDDLGERPPITLDPPRHTAFRQLLLPGFAPAQIRKLEPDLRATCRNAIAEISGDTCDVSKDYAKKIPPELICSMMGVSVNIAPQFAQWAADINESTDIQDAFAAGAAMAQWMAGEVAGHADNPQDDLITLLARSEFDGQRLSPEELIGSLVLIMLGGMDTAWSVISSMLWHLAQHPDDRRRLVEDPSLIPTAIEEFLRFYAPLNLARITTTATTVNGVEIGEDESVLMCYGSANRDAEVFDRPDEVVIDRYPNRHMAFGLGPHRCIGSNIARLELKVALEEWLAAFPEFSLADPDAVHWTLGQVWGPQNVRLRLERHAR
jgi:cytochrome P450